MQKCVLLSLTFALVMAGCASRSVVKEDLAKLPANILMDKAAERYSTYDYKGALTYYQAVIDYHPQRYEEVAWARYEIGYIYYIQKKYDKAKEYFEAASSTPTAPHGVIILSEMMLKKIPAKASSPHQG
ncbi:MAG: tetratricopeptide repeat protein [Brevinematales bacterium]|nr:tetratricopeptide repeat protein [Brevinematales bacterium]